MTFAGNPAILAPPNTWPDKRRGSLSDLSAQSNYSTLTVCKSWPTICHTMTLAIFNAFGTGCVSLIWLTFLVKENKCENRHPKYTRSWEGFSGTLLCEIQYPKVAIVDRLSILRRFICYIHDNTKAESARLIERKRPGIRLQWPWAD